MVRWDKTFEASQPNVVPPGADCVDPRQQPSEDIIGVYYQGTFIGCGAFRIIARNGEHSGNHESLSPYLTGGSALFILLLLLWITTRFNRDR